VRIPATALAKARIARRLSQRELARQLGVSPSTLSAVENGWQAPWPKLRADCARALKCGERELFPPGEARRW
jgi:transcriptional regulator with XRE-family HTH domain